MNGSISGLWPPRRGVITQSCISHLIRLKTDVFKTQTPKTRAENSPTSSPTRWQFSKTLSDDKKIERENICVSNKKRPVLGTANVKIVELKFNQHAGELSRLRSAVHIKCNELCTLSAMSLTLLSQLLQWSSWQRIECQRCVCCIVLHSAECENRVAKNQAKNRVSTVGLGKGGIRAPY